MPDIRKKEHRDDWDALIRVSRFAKREGKGTVIVRLDTLIAAAEQLEAYEGAEEMERISRRILPEAGS